MTSLLIIYRSPPHSTGTGQEGLDAVLAAVAMDLLVSIAFVDDGVFLLAKKATAKPSKLRSYTKGFAALFDLGVDQVYVDSVSADSRGLADSDFSIEAKAMEQKQLCHLIAKHDRVLTF